MIGLNRLIPVATLSALAALSMAAAPASATTTTVHPQKVASKTCHNAKGHRIACGKEKTAALSTSAKPKKN